MAPKLGEAGVALEIDEIAPLCTPLCSVHVSEPNNEYIKKWLFDFLLENLGKTQSRENRDPPLASLYGCIGL